MAGCWLKFNRYFFPRDLTSLHAGSLMLGVTAYRTIKTVLFVMMLAIICYNQTTIQYAIVYYSHIEEEFIYLTEWGVWLTFFYLTVSTFNMMSHKFRGKPLWSGVWKLETVLFLTALVNEFVITVVFWSILFEYQEKTVKNIIQNLLIHLLPCLFLWTDSLINPIAADSYRHIIYIGVIDVVYFSINMAYSLAVKPVYVPITFRSWMTLVYIAGALFLGLIQFIVYKYFYKKKKSSKIDEQLGTYRQSLLSGNDTEGPGL